MATKANSIAAQRARAFAVRAYGLALMLAIALISCEKSHGQARWPDERQAGQLSLHADFRMDHLQPLLNDLANLERDLMATLKIGESAEITHVYLFAEQKTHDRYVKTYFPNVPYRRALFIKARGPGMVFAHLGRDFEIDLRHETTHALLHDRLPMVPMWLDEGLAEYFEVPANKRAKQNPHMSQLSWNVRLGSVPTLSKLEEVRELKDMGNTEYRNSWAWVHFMLHGPPEANEELVGFLADIKSRTPPGQLSDRLRRRIPDLDRKFLDHFREWTR